jgi:hypothetical protein
MACQADSITVESVRVLCLVSSSCCYSVYRYFFDLEARLNFKAPIYVRQGLISGSNYQSSVFVSLCRTVASELWKSPHSSDKKKKKQT